MKFAELKDKSKEELRDLLLQKREELRKLRFKASEQQLKQLHTIREIRREISQIMSLLQD